MSITQALFELSSPNLVRWWLWTARNVPGCYLWATAKSKMAAAAILKKRKMSVTLPLFELFSQNLVSWWP